MQRANVLKHIGSAFMALSFFILVTMYYPVARVYFFPPELTPEQITAPGLYIPKIQAAAPIIYNVNPWKSSEYQDVLQQGIAHAEETALPGEDGTAYLFAHSSDNPWNITRYNTIFLRLGELVQNDEIILTTEEKTYTYKVTEKKEVWPDEVESLINAQNSPNAQKNNTVILQTCTPIGTDLKRLLVFAELSS
jgi:LPXTG-site transpeptidase (sortase) family protein